MADAPSDIGIEPDLGLENLSMATDDLVAGAPRQSALGVVFRAAALVAGVQFFVALEGSLLLPLGPILCQSLHFAPQKVGYLNSAFLVAAAIAGLIGSLYLDLFERRAALAVALGALAVCTALASLATNLETLMGCRFLAGLCGGPAAALGLAVIGDTAPPHKRARAMGTVAAGSGLAIILGVPIALSLAEAIGWRTMLLVIGAVGIGLACCAFALLPKGLGHRSDTTLHQAAREFGAMLHRTDTLLLLATTALVMASTLVMASNLAPYFVFNLGVPERDLKYIWMSGGVFGLIASQGASQLAHHFGPTRVLWGLSFLSVVTFFMLFVQQPVLFPVIVLFCSFMVCANGRIVMVNTISSLASRDETRGRFMSLVAASNQLLSAGALILAGLVLHTTANGVIVNIPLVGGFGIFAALLSPILATALNSRTSRAALFGPKGRAV